MGWTAVVVGRKVLKRIRPLNCCLQLPESMKLHSVWHVSYLKAFKPEGCRPPPAPPEIIDGELELEVDRIRSSQKKQATEYLIQWKGYGAEHDFWQGDTENMPDIVKAVWNKKRSDKTYLVLKLTERTQVMVPGTRQHGVQSGLLPFQ